MEFVTGGNDVANLTPDVNVVENKSRCEIIMRGSHSGSALLLHGSLRRVRVPHPVLNSLHYAGMG